MPYQVQLLVALPEFIYRPVDVRAESGETIQLRIVPDDVSSHVLEWRAAIDPLRAISRTAEIWLDAGEHFLIRDVTAFCDDETVELLRRVASLPRLVELFRGCVLELHEEPPVEQLASILERQRIEAGELPGVAAAKKPRLPTRLRNLSQGQSTHLANTAMPVLLGLAVIYTLELPIGPNGRAELARLARSVPLAPPATAPEKPVTAGARPSPPRPGAQPGHPGAAPRPGARPGARPGFQPQRERVPVPEDDPDGGAAIARRQHFRLPRQPLTREFGQSVPDDDDD